MNSGQWLSLFRVGNCCKSMTRNRPTEMRSAFAAVRRGTGGQYPQQRHWRVDRSITAAELETRRNIHSQKSERISHASGAFSSVLWSPSHDCFSHFFTRQFALSHHHINHRNQHRTDNSPLTTEHSARIYNTKTYNYLSYNTFFHPFNFLQWHCTLICCINCSTPSPRHVLLCNPKCSYSSAGGIHGRVLLFH